MYLTFSATYQVRLDSAMATQIGEGFLNQTMPLILHCFLKDSANPSQPFGLELLWKHCIFWGEEMVVHHLISHDDNRASKPTEFESAWIVWIIRNSMWKWARAGKGLWWYSQTCKIYLRLITSSLEKNATIRFHNIALFVNFTLLIFPLSSSLARFFQTNEKI